MYYRTILWGVNSFIYINLIATSSLLQYSFFYKGAEFDTIADYEVLHFFANELIFDFHYSNECFRANKNADSSTDNY